MGLTILKDVPYGTHERQKVDIFIPENIKNKTGLILFIHGGGWVSGDKAVHHPDAEFFTELGYICATTNYRYVSENIHLDCEFEDITKALETIKDKCAEHDLNVTKLLLSGGSAGAHLALLYAYTKHNSSPILPVATCCYCPPSDCTRKDFLMGISGEFEDWKYDVLSKVCGVEINKKNLESESSQKALAKISPINYVKKSCIPTAIFYGKVDTLIPPKHITDFAKKLKEANIKHDLVLYENSDHALNKDPESSIKSREIIKAYAEMYF